MDSQRRRIRPGPPSCGGHNPSSARCEPVAPPVAANSSPHAHLPTRGATVDITLGRTPDADRGRRMHQPTSRRMRGLFWAGGTVFLVAGAPLVVFGFAYRSIPAESGGGGLILAGALYFYIP